MAKLKTKFEIVVSEVVTWVIIIAFTLTMFGWLLWSAKWVLSLLGVI